MTSTSSSRTHRRPRPCRPAWTPHRAKFSLLLKLPGCGGRCATPANDRLSCKKDYDTHFHEQVLPPYLEWSRSKRAEDLTELDDAGPGTQLRGASPACDERLRQGGDQAVLLRQRRLGRAGRAVDQRYLANEEGPALARLLAAGLDNDKTVEANFGSSDVARGQADAASSTWRSSATGPTRSSSCRSRAGGRAPAFLDTMLETFRPIPTPTRPAPRAR